MELDITLEEFKRIYNEMSYKEIEERYGINSYYIAKAAKTLGLSKPVGRRKKGITFKDESNN